MACDQSPVVLTVLRMCVTEILKNPDWDLLRIFQRTHLEFTLHYATAGIQNEATLVSHSSYPHYSNEDVFTG